MTPEDREELLKCSQRIAEILELLLYKKAKHFYNVSFLLSSFWPL